MRIGTLNLGAQTVKRHPRLTYANVRDVFRVHGVDGLAVQEAGLAERILADLKADGVCQVWQPHDRVGKAATPILLRPGITVTSTVSLFLSPRTFVGLPGAGINPWAKPKWLNVVHWLDDETGRACALGTFHGESSAVLNPLRRRLAQRITRAVGIHVARPNGLAGPGCLWVGADTNLQPGHKYLRPIYAGGMISAQLARGPVPTHGHRAIDDVFHRDRRDVVRLDSIERHAVASDHDLFIADYTLKPRLHRP